DQQQRLVSAAQRRLLTLFDASPVATLITEPEDGTILHLNPAVERMSGLARSQIIGRSSLEFGTWADHAQRRRLIADTLFSGEGHTIERQLTFPGMAPLVVLVTFRAIEWEGKNRLLVMLQYITSRRAAEDTLR